MTILNILNFSFKKILTIKMLYNYNFFIQNFYVERELKIKEI